MKTEHDLSAVKSRMISHSKKFTFNSCESALNSPEIDVENKEFIKTTDLCRSSHGKVADRTIKSSENEEKVNLMRKSCYGQGCPPVDILYPMTERPTSESTKNVKP